jgi:hypothetical protein
MPKFVFSSSSTPLLKEDVVDQAYHEWCQKYKVKVVDDTRKQIFAFHYWQSSLAEGNVQLNEYADMTLAEYQHFQSMHGMYDTGSSTGTKNSKLPPFVSLLREEEHPYFLSNIKLQQKKDYLFQRSLLQARLDLQIKEKEQRFFFVPPSPKTVASILEVYNQAISNSIQNDDRHGAAIICDLAGEHLLQLHEMKEHTDDILPVARDYFQKALEYYQRTDLVIMPEHLEFLRDEIANQVQVCEASTDERIFKTEEP